MRVLICQTNSCVGDLRGNLQLMQTEIAKSVQQQCDVIVFPEMVTTGYPPRDLLYKQELWDNHQLLVQKVEQFVANLGKQITVIFGGIHQVQQSYGRCEKYNAAFIIDPSGTQIVHKRLLPQHDVFDESRYFKSGIDEPYLPVNIKVSNRHSDELNTVACDVIICADMWNYKFRNRDLYDADPISHLSSDGPIFILNASVFWEGKLKETKQIVESICRDTERPICWINQVGGQDDLVMGGYSMVSIPTSALAPNTRKRIPETRVGKLFTEDRMTVQFSDSLHYHDALYPGADKTQRISATLYGKDVEESDFDVWCDFSALRLHLIDYCRHTGFQEVVLGLSGGIDSALVCAIACSALGSSRVTGIAMPSKYSSDESFLDAEKLASNLSVNKFITYPIEELHSAIRSTILSGGRQEFDNPITDQNIQARARMIILMSESNDGHKLLLATGNKSELSMGYSTLYGDMAGGLAPISDIPKTRVYEICRMLNKYSDTEIIPSSTLIRPPSAELREDQLDSDELPPYDKLDPILEDFLADMPIAKIKERSSIPNQVGKILRKFTMNEYKRQQLPIGPKVRKRSFGPGRRMPIAADYRLI